jgi:hypothetical protein
LDRCIDLASIIKPSPLISLQGRANMKPFTFISAVVFWLIAVAHILRLFGGWEVTLNGMVVPLRVSVLGAVLAAGLAMMLWREMRK